VEERRNGGGGVWVGVWVCECGVRGAEFNAGATIQTEVCGWEMRCEERGESSAE